MAARGGIVNAREVATMKLRAVVLVGLMSSVVACAGAVKEESTQSSASALAKAPVGAGTHGVVKAMGDALGEVPLRPDQRSSLEALAQAAETRHAPLVADRKDLMLAVADQIEQGAIDRGALQPKIAKITTDFAAVRDDDRAAIAKLHDTLDSEQRGAFVDAIEGQFKAKHGDHPFARMKALSDELKLTSDQRSQIRGTLKDEMKAHHGGKDRPHPKAMLEAFRQDKLDLDKVAPPRDLSTERGEHITALAEKLLPILTPEQRKIAAAKVRAAADGDPLAN
jgi:Spy/CpxP family protein refolding chaperone